MVGRPVAAALLSLLAALHPGLEVPVTSFVQVGVLIIGCSRVRQRQSIGCCQHPRGAERRSAVCLAVLHSVIMMLWRAQP
jgi:hypothetical protein